MKQSTKKMKTYLHFYGMKRQERENRNCEDKDESERERHTHKELKLKFYVLANIFFYYDERRKQASKQA